MASEVFSRSAVMSHLQRIIVISIAVLLNQSVLLLTCSPGAIAAQSTSRGGKQKTLRKRTPFDRNTSATKHASAAHGHLPNNPATQPLLISSIPAPSLPPPPINSNSSTPDQPLYSPPDDWTRLPQRSDDFMYAESTPPGTPSPVLAPPELPPPPLDQAEQEPAFAFEVKTEKSTERAIGPKLLEGTPLAPGELTKLFARLQPLPIAPAVSVNIAPKPLPPPAGAKILLSPFPAPAAPLPRPQRPAVGPLTVLRTSPAGQITQESKQLVVAFSQPMVPLSTLAEANSQQHKNVTLKPEPPGIWRWLDTSTIVFQPKGGFLPSTKYIATVSSGVQSALGGKLASPVQWSFQTPTPQVLDFDPKESAPRSQPNMVALFTQKIQPSSAISKIKVRVKPPAGGEVIFPVRALTSEEIKKDPYIAELMKTAEKDYHGYLPFKSDKPFPLGAKVQVQVESGIASMYGPLTGTEPKTFKFTTDGALKLMSSAVDVRPNDYINIAFNNPINTKLFKSSMVQIKPPIPKSQITAYDRQISISGTKKSGTTYQITIAGDVTDRNGQKLGHEKIVNATTLGYEPRLYQYGYNNPQYLPPGQFDLPIFTMNISAVKVTGYKVPVDYPYYDFEELLKSRKPDYSTKVAVKKAPDSPVETSVKLEQLFPDGFGAAMVRIEPVTAKPDYGVLQMLVRSTRLGIKCDYDERQAKVFVTSLDTGKPLAGASVRLVDYKTKTDSNGLASIPVGADSESRTLTVSYGKDSSVQALERSYADEYQNVFYAFTDRGAYRPGEEVFVKGCVRRIGRDPLADLSRLVAGTEFSVSCQAQNTGQSIFAGKVKLDSCGAFNFSFKVPEDAATGRMNISINGQSVAGIVNEEYRRPEFTVSVVDQHPEKAHFFGSAAKLQVDANYYSGGPLGGADINWNVTANRANFTPAGWDEFSFGPIDSPSAVSHVVNSTTDATGKGILSVDLKKETRPWPVEFQIQAEVKDINRQAFSGSSSIIVHPARKFVGIKLKESFIKSGEAVHLAAVSTDVDGKIAAGSVKFETFKREWKDSKLEDKLIKEETLIEKDAAVNFESRFPEQGEYLLRVTTTDEDGHSSVAERSLWVYGDSPYWRESGGNTSLELSADKKDYKAGDVARIAVKSKIKNGLALVVLSRRGIFQTRLLKIQGGLGIIEIPIEDSYVPQLDADVYLVEQREKPESHDGAWWTERAFGSISLTVPPITRTLKVSAIADKPELEPGAKNAVTIKVQDSTGAPVADSQVAVAVVDESVLVLTNYSMPDPVETLYRSIVRPVLSLENASGLTAMDVAQVRRQAAAQLKQGEYEEAASSLPPPCLPPPPLPAGRDGGMVARPGMLAAPSPAPGNAPPTPPTEMAAGKVADAGGFAAGGFAAGATRTADSSSPPAVPVAIRKNFNPLAAFVASATTDNAGQTTVSFSMPDNLTRYRIMVFALAKDKYFGRGEASITARLPLALRQSPPRFLNVGDQCQIAFVLQNQTDSVQKVEVGFRGTTSGIMEGAGKSVSLAANERGELRFPVKADTPGKAFFQAIAASGAFGDAQEFSIPVLTPASSETFANYGQIDEKDAVVNQPLKPPVDVYPQYGGLEFSTSSTALQELSDAVVYLHHYSYECSEQLSSRIMVLASLKDVSAALSLPGISIDDLTKDVAASVKELSQRQNSAGQFGFWSVRDKSYPYVNVCASHAMAIARAKGFLKDDQVIERCKNVLRDLLHDPMKDYDSSTRQVTQAYALYVLSLFGVHDQNVALKLLNERTVSDHSPEVLAWLLLAEPKLQSSGEGESLVLKTLRNKVIETSSTASCDWSSGFYSYVTFQSPVRTSALVLNALIGADPSNAVIPKMVKGLMRARQQGRWSNTQENAMACIALDRYFRTYEKVSPDFIARLWLGDSFLGEEKFVGRTTETHLLKVPTSSLYSHWEKEEPLLLSKTGPGRLYYRLGLSYASRATHLKSMDNGFEVTRSYEAVDDPADVKKDDRGVWHIKAGALVRVRLSLKNPGTRYHVALVDPLPAGLEPLNPELEGTRNVADDASRDDLQPYYWYRSQWFDFTNLRDYRAEVFSGLLSEGQHKYSYVTRATSYGTYIVPPAHAEEMYEPETFGRSASEDVVIE